jgi:mono/diheme cytochrome c family protein
MKARLAALAFACGATAGLAKEIQLPPETVALKKADSPGYVLASGLCVTCHSADYVAYQPPNEPKAFWLAEATKMKKVYGAPITDAQLDPIAEYLEATYGAKEAGRPQ